MREDLKASATLEVDKELQELRINNTILEYVRGMDSKLTRIDVLVGVHLGKGGTLENLQRKVDGMHSRMLLAFGGGAVVVWLLNKVHF